MRVKVRGRGGMDLLDQIDVATIGDTIAANARVICSCGYANGANTP